jgi:acyl carrier protein
MQEINENVKKMLSKQFGIELDKIHTETHLVDDLGADSLDLMEVAMLIETKFRIRIEEAEYNNALVVGKIVSLIEQKQQELPS